MENSKVVEVIRTLMLSELYFDFTPKERLLIVKRIIVSMN